MKSKLNFIFFVGVLTVCLVLAKVYSSPDLSRSGQLSDFTAAMSVDLNSAESEGNHNSSRQFPNLAVNDPDSIPYDFPLGWYDSIENLTTPARIANEGINLVIPYTGDKNVREIELYLDRAASAGIKVLVEIPRPAVQRKSIRRAQQFVSELKTHPAVFGWYLYDEPVPNRISPPALQQVYRAIKAEDPKHTVVVAFNRLIRITEYSEALDTVMYGKYPVLYNSAEFDGFQNGIFKRLIDTGVSVTDDRHDFWFIVQAYGEDRNGRPQFNKRLPTATEEKYMVYSAILSGADGLFFWAHYRAQQQWIDSVLTPIITELQNYLPAITNGTMDDRLTVDNSAIQTSLYRDPTTEDLLLIAVNHSESKLETAIATKNLQAYYTEILQENRRLDLDRGILNDTFEPYAVHIYRFKSS
ncbi:hypothetical protein IQ255_17275 [Pleurocapsales cyanobacterium LEGE 10410]|nr:hypothetical protein [Pleurocapsales cyanobacterium LEGE 10410]